ncbi:hypothetical protein HJG60_009157 [Phyllostomus discolor]|uniref:Uncharacterized protein n=1 Tax=Phyllostomus discolor TaxID=89673 RepID=A0A834DHB5_9CHIR|nr:hypothetical protein HJG60_009157 [Phyllostomus discolor]
MCENWRVLGTRGSAAPETGVEYPPPCVQVPSAVDHFYLRTWVTTGTPGRLGGPLGPQGSSGCSCCAVPWSPACPRSRWQGVPWHSLSHLLHRELSARAGAPELHTWPWRVRGGGAHLQRSLGCAPQSPGPPETRGRGCGGPHQAG